MKKSRVSTIGDKEAAAESVRKTAEKTVWTRSTAKLGLFFFIDYEMRFSRPA